ncbi:NTP transferase domain-containing protein [Pseudomonas sp. KK4]|uniref:phosphocholine cytidylyltransferase family protein n=1 Tax=Pseudomonas sp. KK4 TaxID=1855729 RepID=UPI00158947F8|nr:phosphocholine cytidylyltransferase family protein [Pseudomonas sp. KK4]
MGFFEQRTRTTAIILSAGQGRRLLPYTANSPKCLIDVGGLRVIEWQIDALMAAGITRITAVIGYGADQVEKVLHDRYGPGVISTIYNPFFEVADNLASCWMARHVMHDDFILLNGDTLFEPPVLERLLDAPARAITLAIDKKPAYDSDDMKVSLVGDRISAVSKQIALDSVDGESIGMMHFQAGGGPLFRSALEDSMRRPEALQNWYLSIINHLASTTGQVFAQSIEGLDWNELDFPADLKAAQALVKFWACRKNGTAIAFAEDEKESS